MSYCNRKKNFIFSFQLTLMDDDCKSHSAGRFRIESGDLEGSDEVRNCVITMCKTNTLQMVDRSDLT